MSLTETLLSISLITGIIKNTKAIYHKDAYNYILKIRARDCGGKVSDPAYVNIIVKETCTNGWTGGCFVCFIWSPFWENWA